MIRRALRSGLEKSGFVGSAAPLSGLTRMTDAVEDTGSPLVRRSCARRLPPSAVGGVRTAPTPPGGSPHGFERAAVLAPVGEAEGGAVPGRRVEIAVRPELDLALRMARVLLAPVRDEHGLHAGRAHARETPRDDAAVDVAARGVRARVGGRAGGAPAGGRAADGRVVRVEDVDVGIRGELRVERHPEQAAVPVVVHLRAQVRVGARRRVRQAVEDLDQAALLGDEDAPVRREADDHRVRKAGEDDLLLEARRQRGAACRRNRREQAAKNRDEEQTPQ